MKKSIYWVLVLVVLSVFIWSTSSVLKYVKRGNEAAGINSELLEMATVDEQEDTGPDLPIYVNFDVLKEQNEDIIAWIYSEDTPINYPIVQANNNDYYLRRLPDGKWNIAGTLFADFRNASDFSDMHTVIYGHNMDDDSMFGSLSDYRKQEYYDEHPEIYLFTPDKNYIIELFAGYVTDVNSKIYDILLSDAERLDLIENSINRSNFVSDITVGETDKIISLTTCYYTTDTSRYVLLGRLKEIE